MKSYKQFSEGTIQSNGTDKIEIGSVDIASKKKTDKEMKDQQNESWTFDTAAMAKQELADAKNKAHRKRGKVANLLRKLGMKEEVSLDEGLDPSEVASNPKMYSADTAKKAYYHKNASASDKESLERHLDRHHGNKEWRKPVKEEIQAVEEGVFKGTAEVVKQAVRVPYRAVKRVAGAVLDTAKDVGDAAKNIKKKFKEEVEQIDEVNHREYASAGKMHPSMAKHMTAGSECDFYHSSTGDKLSGVVKHKSDKEVHIKAHKDGKMGAGEMHKFTISEELKGGQANLDKNHNGKLDKQDFKLLRKKLKEANMPKPAKAVDVDKVNTAGEKPHEEKWEDVKKVKKESYTADQLLQALKEGMWPGTPEYNAKFGNQAKQGGGAGVKKGTRYGGSLQKPEKEDDNDADDKTAKKPKNK